MGAIMDIVDLDIMDMVDMLDMVDMDLAIGEERRGLLKQSPLPKQIQRLKRILTIFMVDMVDMVDLAIMDIVDLDIMDMVDMLDMLDMVVIMDTENRTVYQLIAKNNIVTTQITSIQFYNDDLFNLNG